MKGLFILGLTGPSGAGKSEVARLLAEKGIPLVDADALVREVQKPGSPCLKALADVFSSAILRPDGSLDRGKLAELAFGSPEQTQRLNRIVHPAVIALSEERLRQAADAGARAAVLDAPLLFESGMDRLWRPDGRGAGLRPRTSAPHPAAGRHHRGAGQNPDGGPARRRVLHRPGFPGDPQ